MWAYPWMIAVLLLFIAYQTYQISLTPTIGLIALTVFDLAIVALTWREYRQQRTRHPTSNAAGAQPSTAADPKPAMRPNLSLDAPTRPKPRPGPPDPS